MEVSNTNTTNGFGLFVRGGVGSTSYAFNVVNAANTVDLFKVMGSGAATFSSSVTIGSTFNINSSSWLQFSGNNVLLGDDGNTFLQASGGGSIIFRNNAAARIMTMTTGGNLLVGTTTDSGFKLDVNGTGRFVSSLTSNSLNINTSTVFVKASIADALSATSVGSNYNPGILNIQNTNTTAGNLSLIGFQDASAFINLAAIGSINEVHSGSPNNVKGSLAFYTKPTGSGYITEKMRITSDGNVLIGTTTDSGDKLQVNGAIKTSAPSGGTAGSWKLGTASSGSFTVGGKIRIEINGVAYDILTT
jgi:hypothetical protein